MYALVNSPNYYHVEPLGKMESIGSKQMFYGCLGPKVRVATKDTYDLHEKGDWKGRRG